MNNTCSFASSSEHVPEVLPMRGITLALLAVWAAAVVYLSFIGWFDPGAGGPQFGTLAAIGIPILVFAAGWRLSARFRARILGINLHAILLLHAWRMVGLGFVFLYAVDRLPAAFALPAGLGDAAAAAWATWLAHRISTGEQISHGHLRRWNAFGLADFMVAVLMGTLSRSGPLGVFSAPVSSDLLGSLPLSLIPTFAVPFFVITHLCVMLKLRHSR